MALTTTLQKVEALYAAYYGRAGDPSGVTYWVNQMDTGGKTFSDLAGYFAAQTESKAAYPYLVNPTLADPAVFVAQIYQNLFARAPDPAGLTYWTDLLKANPGNLAFVAQFINYVVGGAAPADVAVLDNKVAAATYFTQAMATKGLSLTGPDGQLTNEGAAAAKAATATVDGTQASVDASKLASDNFTVTTQFHLTTATDNIIGTSGNDTINAGGLAPDGTTAATTLNVLDTINGGGGIDTLLIDASTGQNLNIQGTITNVENLTVAGGAINTFDATPFSGTIKLQQAGSQTITGLTGQTVILDRAADNTTASLTYAAAQATANLKSTGALGTETFALTGAGLKTVNLTVDKTVVTEALTVTNATIETVNIASSGASTVIVSSAALKTATVTGAGAVTLTVDDDASIDASVNTGGVTAVTTLAAAAGFTGGAGKDSVKLAASTKAITTGAGDDTVSFASALGVGGSVDAGDGVDTIILLAADAAALTTDAKFAGTISNFEKVSVGIVLAGTVDTVNLANLDNINYVKSAGTTGGGNAAVVATFESALATVTGSTSGADTVTFNGVPVALADGDTAAQVAAKLALGVYPNYTITQTVAQAGTGAITVTNKVIGAATNINNASFSYTNATETAPAVAVAVTTDGDATTQEVFTATITGSAAGADTITFGGTLTTLAHGDNAASIATKIAAAINADAGSAWTASAALGVVTFTAKAVGVVTDVVDADFVVVDVASGTPVVTVGAITDGIDAVAAAGLVVDNLAAGGTLELTDTGYTTVNVKDALLGASDTLNIVLANDTAATKAFGTVVAANVETVNIVTKDAGLLANTAATIDTLTLVDTAAKSIVVSGNNGLTLTNTGNTKVTSFDASGVVGNGIDDTAANLAVTFTSANTTGAVSITGGAGNDVLTGNAGVDTVSGGAGNDTINGGKGLDILTGGAGADTFVVNTNTNGSIYATITDAAAGDKLDFVGKGTDTFNKVKVALADTAVFQDYLNEAAKAVIGNDGNVSWFQWGGNTYVVDDVSGSTSFVNDADSVVKLTGLIDLSNATISGDAANVLTLV